MLSSSITNSAPIENVPSSPEDFSKVDYYPKAVSMESIRKKLNTVEKEDKIDGLATNFDDLDKSEHYILPKGDLASPIGEGEIKEDSLSQDSDKHIIVQNSMVLLRIIFTLVLLYFLVSLVKAFLFPVTKVSNGKRKNLMEGKKGGGVGKIGDRSLEQLLDNF